MNSNSKVVLERCSHALSLPKIFQELQVELSVPVQMTSEPITLSTTPNAKFWLDEHHFIVLNESDDVVNKYPHTPDNYWQEEAREPQHLGGTTLLLGAQGDFQYYHWLLDALPKLGILEKAGISLDDIDHVVFREVSTAFHKETLEIAGVPESKIVESVGNPKFTADEVIDIKMSNFVGMTMPEFVPAYLKQLVLGSEDLDRSWPGKRLYIGRPKSLGRRSVSNEEEVVSLLRQFDFEHYEMEDFSVREQAELFNSAEVIVTPHGGALANLVFCQQGCRVVELFANHVFSYFYGLANLCDLDYAAVLKNTDQCNLVVDPMAGNELTNQHVTSKENSIPVDVGDLERAIKGMGYVAQASAA